MFGNNKYMKWLFWGGIVGTTASLVWRMMDKRRMYQGREKKYRFVRSLASKTMRGLRENLEDMMKMETSGKRGLMEPEKIKSKGRSLDRRLIGSSRWFKESKTKWD